MNFTQPTLVTLTAPTASGKSFLLNQLIDRGVLSRIVSTTTRAPRTGEKEGVDYYFISEEQSRQMEGRGEFFELITFNGVRYGVTHTEMQAKMTGSLPPVVVLEPQGLLIYEQKCREQGWGIMKVYVHVTESLRLERLLQRTLSDVWSVIDSVACVPYSRYSQAFMDTSSDNAKKKALKIINEHHVRLIGIAEERRWSNVSSWDVIVPGDDVDKAIEMVKHGIVRRNQKLAEPVPYIHP